MNIAFFTDTFDPQINGLTVSLHNYTKVLREKGHTVYFFAPKIRGYKDKDAAVFRIPSLKIISSEPEARLPALIPSRVYTKMLQMDFDLIHAHGNGGFSLLGYQIAKLKGVPFILTFHNDHSKYTHYIFNGKIIRPKMIEIGLRLFANLCDGVITPSEKMKNELIRYGYKGHIEVIPSFIDLSAYKKVEKGYLRKKLKLPQAAPILLTVGRLGKEKNFTFLLRAFHIVAKKNPDLQLVVVGKGPLESSLKKLAKSLGVARQTHFTGKIEPKMMPSVYRDADIFVFASNSETQGMCVLEAAASGLPFVVIKDQAFAGVVANGKNGFEVPANRKIFAEKIEKLLKNQELREGFGEESKKMAQRNFQPEKLTSHLLDFYSLVLNQQKAKKKFLERIIDRNNFVTFIKATEMVNKFIGLRR